MNSRPYFGRGSCEKKGDDAAKGCTAEQTSWIKPGRVSSADRAPPPIVSFASRTQTDRPERAISMAADNPFGPDPITIASYVFPTSL